MGKTAITAEGSIKKNQPSAKPVYKDMKGRKICLIIGFILCLDAFCLVLAAMLMAFIPNLSVNPAGITQFELGIRLYGIGAGAAFLGLIMAVAGANTKKSLARFGFFFGILAFIVGFVMLIICLFFKTILPIRALQEASACFLL